jgi:hypothetical protein
MRCISPHRATTNSAPALGGCSAVFGYWACCTVMALFDRFISIV